MDNILRLRHVLDKINKTCAKSSNKYYYSISDSSSSDSNSYISSDSERYKLRNPDERKYMNRLDQVVTNNITNKNNVMMQ